jgi:hypothetical protein
MTPDRLAEIIEDAQSRGAMRQATHTGFREAAERDYRGEAKAEYEEYVGTVHGRRAPKAELQRIEREILHEREANWRDEVEKALTLDGYSHEQEIPTLRAHERECSEAPSAAEAYEHAVSDRGGADRPLMLALLEQVTRRDVRSELARLGPAAALEFYKRAISASGTTPDQIVKRSILIAEVERRSSWAYDAKGENAATEHASARELARLVAETRAARVPREVREALAQAEEARKYAERMRQIHRLQVRSINEVLGPADPEAAEKAERLVKGRRPGAGHADE